MTQWTREQIEHLLQTEQFRYQRIELPYGLATRGADRSATARQIFPDDLRGKSVLDVGCSHGFFCFEAVKRGATRVVGLDVESETVRKNRLLAQALGMDVEFGVLDIEREQITERFDYVLCLNVLHHLSNPLAALDQLTAVARERLVLEMASFGRHDRKRLGLFPLVGQILAKAPLVYVTKNGSTGKHRLKKFFITRRGMDVLLGRHRHAFAKVDSLPSQHKGRYVVLAHKQRIDHLVVVSGPVAAGKTYFCNSLLAGELPAIATQLGIAAGSYPPLIGTSHKAQSVAAGASVALFHYGFLRTYGRKAKTPAHDETLDVLDCANRRSFVTLWTPPQTLVERITKGEIDNAPGGKPSPRHLALREEYRDPARVVELYERWIEFVAARGERHWIAVEDGAQRRLISVEEWRALVAPLRAVGEPLPPSGTQPEATTSFDAILPADLTGKTLLDANCGDGALCLEAARRGAKVLGIDAEPDNIHRARQAARRANLPVEFVLGDGAGQLQGPFDLTICLDLLDRVRDPLGLLDRLIAVTRGRLALDTGTIDAANRGKLGIAPGLGALLARAPVMYAAKNGAASKHQTGKFAISDGALRHLLQHHRRFFHHVELAPSPIAGRRLAVADKYQIDHLIVVSAPVSGGKTTFCNKLVAGQLDQVYDALGVAREQRPHAVFLPRARGSALPADRKTVLFHYNFLNPYVSAARIAEHDENLDILRCARRLSFLTLWATPERLVRQITKSEIEGGPFHRPAKRHVMLREEYRDPAKVLGHYDTWIDFVERQGGTHFVVEQEDGPVRLLSVPQWRELVAPLRTAASA